MTIETGELTPEQLEAVRQLDARKGKSVSPKVQREALIKQHLKKGVLVYDADERDATGKRKPRFYGRNAYKRAKRQLEREQRKQELLRRQYEATALLDRLKIADAERNKRVHP